MLWEWLIQPFIDFGFMRRAMAGSFALAIAAGPLGVFLILRRMSLMGDAMAHAILPGVAVGFLTAGLSLGAMAIGGVITGLVVALLAGAVARFTPLREDASFAAFYLVSLGLGVLLVSLRGSNMDLLHVLFGTVLGLDDSAVILVSATSSIALIILSAIYRPLVMECLDPLFLRAQAKRTGWVHATFLILLVITLVAGFQVLGTLMVVGIMMLPAASARFWVHSASSQMMCAAVLGVLTSYAGLLFSFHADVPASPAIILMAGLVYFLSIFFGRHGGIWHSIHQAAQRHQRIAQGGKDEKTNR